MPKEAFTVWSEYKVFVELTDNLIDSTVLNTREMGDIHNDTLILFFLQHFNGSIYTLGQYFKETNGFPIQSHCFQIFQ